MTVIGYIFLAVAVGLLIVGFTSKKAWPAVVACFLGSLGVAILFDGLALYLLGTGVLAFVALFFGRRAARVVVALGVILTLLVAVPVGKFWNNNGSDNSTSSGVVPSASASPSPSPSPSASQAPDVVYKDLGLSDKDAKAIGTQLSDIYVGYKPGEIAVGAGSIPDSAEERGGASFTKDTIETRADIPRFFASNHPQAASARKRVEQNLRAGGVSDAEVKQALTSGERWIWVAPNVESQVLGTTYSINNGVLKSDSWRQVAPNDAIWFYVTRDARIVAGASVRADCGNPEVDKVRPVRPNTPPAPPIECAVNCEPPPPPPSECVKNCSPCKEDCTPVKRCPDGKPINPDGTCPKDPPKDVNVNPAVPDPVKGPGTTPVGKDPGPATRPTDSPTGCNGPCPRPTNDPRPPSPVATERPQGDPNGGSGNGGATQGPGPVDDSDRGQTTSPAPSASSGLVCGTGDPDDC